MTLRGIIAAVLAGVCGVLTAFGTAAVLLHPIFILMPVAGPQVFLFAVGLAAVVPLVQRWLPGARGSVLALFPVMIGSHLLMAIPAPANLGQPVALALSFVFAITVVSVDGLVRRFVRAGGPAGAR